MYPSPQPHGLALARQGGAGASPKKKPRPNVMRQMFALPAIHHFEPVLSSSPRSQINTAASSQSQQAFDGSASSVTAPPLTQRSQSPVLSPQQIVMHPKGSVEKESPRFRPQPPPPVGLASRSDQDLYRYSQATKQRLSIRPLFEHRREEEAEIAQRIIASREVEAATRQRGHASSLIQPAEPAERSVPTTPRRPSVSGSEDAHVSEGSSHRRRRESTRASTKRRPEDDSHISTGAESTFDDRDSDIMRVRFTPPSSAGPSRSQVQADPQPLLLEVVNKLTAQESAVMNIEHLESAGVSEVGENTQAVDDVAVTNPEVGSSEPEATCYHAPFLDTEGPKLTWLHSTSLSQANRQRKSELISVESKLRINAPPPDIRVCYKLLWKEVRTFGLAKCTLSALLDSNGRAQIRIHSSEESQARQEKREDSTIPITDKELLLSAKTRPDLPILTPKWGEWILSCVCRDDSGKWFVVIEDIFALGDACCLCEEVTVPAPGEQSHRLNVSVYVLGADNLLVHAREHNYNSQLEAPVLTVQSMTEVIIKRQELIQFATASGFLRVEPQDVVTDEAMTALLRNQAFVRRVVIEGKALRLALKSGLHCASDSNVSVADLPFRTGSPGRTGAPTVSGDDSAGGLTVSITKPSTFVAQGLSYPVDELQQLVTSNEDLACVAFLSQAYCEDAVLAVSRWFQRREAVEAYVDSYVNPLSGEMLTNLSHSESVRSRIAAAKREKLDEIATHAIIEDMIADFISSECRLELHHAKFSGGYDNFFASKVQATYRMSYHRREYVTKKHVRLRAARLIQALQRGIIARRRYCEMRVEREKYLFYGFRSSLHHSTASIQDPKQRASDIAHDTERRRQTFLMQVLHGYVHEHGVTVPFRISPELVQSIFNEYGVVVGCSSTLGETVAAILISQHRPRKLDTAPRLYSSTEINAALLVGLRAQYDDTYGLTATIRELEAVERSPNKAQRNIASSRRVTGAGGDENTPPRWLLKTSTAFQRANRNRLASLRLTRNEAGRRASHLVAVDYRDLLVEGFDNFEKCRAAWESSIRTRADQTAQFDAFSVDELVQYALDRLVLALKDWGVDPEPLFESLNLCLMHRHGKQVIAMAEAAFDRFAEGVNTMHGKRNIHSLRDEIVEELEDFERLLALRCLNIAHDNVVTVPPSEILHVLLHGRVDEEYLRHALPAVLPIATITDKHELANKMITAYANVKYADAFNAICWSTLDTAESVTVEAAQFLDHITRPRESRDDDQLDNSLSRNGGDTSVAARALYLLTGSHALRFLQFLAKVAHFKKSIQRRVLELLLPYGKQYELYSLAAVVCSLENFDLVTRLFDEAFSAAAVYPSTRFWVQYGLLYGLQRAETARACCPSSVTGGAVDSVPPEHGSGEHEPVM